MSHFISTIWASTYWQIQGIYDTWCEKNDFKSKLPKAVKKVEVEAAEATLKQGQLDGHLQEVPHKEWIVPYTDALFCEAAIQWLAATDQVIISYAYIMFNSSMDGSVLT